MQVGARQNLDQHLPKLLQSGNLHLQGTAGHTTSNAQ